MKKISLVFLVLLTLLFSLNVNAATFNFNFDKLYDDFLIEPAEGFVGFGSFSFVGSMPNGTYELENPSTGVANFSNYSFDFSFDLDNDGTYEYNFVANSSGPNYFNMITHPATVVVIIDDYGLDGQQATFDTYNGFPATFYGGSLEILDPVTNSILSFEPSLFGNPLIHYALIDGYTGEELLKGNYGMTSAVPVPAAVWLFGSGVAGLALLRRKRS